MKAFIAVAAVAALLAGASTASIARADDSPSASTGQPKLKTPHDPAVDVNKARSTTGSGAMAPSAAEPANTPGVKGSKPYTPDTKAK
jgi:hypothetical protein